ncbi:MAG TPA: CRISPR-associated endonuclease Cas1 [Candidatus Acidoferrum sp.]|nr:CRISPR-associated endonuclease Cas1 [Candidatus Acidoferrum sp.]
MAANETVTHFPSTSKSTLNRSGVLVLSGFGIKARVHIRHLELEDGVGLERRKFRLARVGHGLKRLICIGSDGFVSLSALRWLADQDVAFTMLERSGKVLFVTGPVRSSDAKLRRAQALAHSSGAALRISRELIRQKLVAQEQVARLKLLDSRTADEIARFRDELPRVESINSIRLMESQAARSYWSAWSTLPINFPKNQLPRLPAHWLSFGMRVSPLTGSPRLACNPPNCILNFLYALLECEARLSAACLGLDPGLGVLHVDTTARDSLACDIMEPIRAQVDSYVLDLITREYLSRSWFVEERDGNCRLSAEFVSRLAQTAPMWSRVVAPVAEWVAREFWKTIRRPDAPLATRLTQGKKREAKGGALVPPPIRPTRQEHLCPECGKTIQAQSTKCVSCAAGNATKNMLHAARIGRQTANGPEAQVKRAIKARKNALAQHSWNPSDQMKWLTPEFFKQKVQPLLATLPMSAIRSSIGVSKWYASKIRQGYRPHPRHWKALASLTGIELPA